MQETLTIGAAVLGITQIIKDTGYVDTKWLQLVAVGLGAIFTLASLYYPEIWRDITGVLIAAGITGGVSFVNEQRSK